MKSPYQLVAVGAALFAVTMISDPVLGAEPQPGLWEHTMTMDLSGTELPPMPDLPPEVLAQMEAAGVQIPNMNSGQPQAMTHRYCLTAEEIANREPFDLDEEMDDCRQENLQLSDTGMSMDIVCTGSITGTGHIEYVFDSPRHYTGSMTMQGSSQGVSTNMSNTVEGNWLSADCGDEQ